MDSFESRKEEINAMQKIYEALLPLNDFQKRTVLQWAYTGLSHASTSKSISMQIDSTPSIQPSSVETGIIPGESIQDFITRKNPTNTYQRLACLAFYLEKTENKLGFTLAELSQANDVARQVRISNISASMQDAISKYQYFSSKGGIKTLLTKGEQLVRALPDPEKAKEFSTTTHRKKSLVAK